MPTLISNLYYKGVSKIRGGKGKKLTVSYGIKKNYELLAIFINLQKTVNPKLYQENIKLLIQ